MFLQDNLRAASLSTATPTIRCMVRWLLLLIIVDDRGIIGRILTFFLAIWLLELLLLFLLFQFSIHGITTLSHLIDKLIFVESFLRFLLVFILIRCNQGFVIFKSLNLFIAHIYFNIFRGVERSICLESNSHLLRFICNKVSLINSVFLWFLQFLDIIISFIDDLLIRGLQFLDLLRLLGILLLKFCELERLLLSNLFLIICVFLRGSILYWVKLTL